MREIFRRVICLALSAKQLARFTEMRQIDSRFQCSLCLGPSQLADIKHFDVEFQPLVGQLVLRRRQVHSLEGTA
jgi:hypothetical protein